MDKTKMNKDIIIKTIKALKNQRKIDLYRIEKFKAQLSKLNNIKEAAK